MKRRRNLYRMRAYKEKYGYKCMNPECDFGFHTETHHIVPLARGGADNQDNYIILCWKCHRLTKRHSQYRKFEVALATWKYYFEALHDSVFAGNQPPALEDEIQEKSKIDVLRLSKEKVHRIPWPVSKNVKGKPKNHGRVAKHIKDHAVLAKIRLVVLKSPVEYIKYSRHNGSRRVRKGFGINCLKE